MRTGWYREVGVKSLENHRVRAVLGARAQLVGMRTDIRNQIRGLLKVSRRLPGSVRLYNVVMDAKASHAGGGRRWTSRQNGSTRVATPMG
jgi:hypothetical protein